MNKKVKALAIKAADVVKHNGGEITFDEFNKVTKNMPIMIPFNWIDAWGMGYGVIRANAWKRAIFAACELGLVQQDAARKLYVCEMSENDRAEYVKRRKFFVAGAKEAVAELLEHELIELLKSRNYEYDYEAFVRKCGNE